MIDGELRILIGSAAAIGLLHTVVGPDHYLPFVALAKARGWSRRRTISVTALCGLGHVAGSVLIGTIGIASGIGLKNLKLVESHRGEIAAWLLIALGLGYGVWGMVRGIRGRPHTHSHVHEDGRRHRHQHTHTTDHLHPHTEEGGRVTPWMLFVFFVLGPCEPLIPLLMYPAATSGTTGVVLVASVFGTVTIATMVGLVWFSSLGLSVISSKRLGRFAHAIAGGMIFLCGVAIQLGL